MDRRQSPCQVGRYHQFTTTVLYTYIPDVPRLASVDKFEFYAYTPVLHPVSSTEWAANTVHRHLIIRNSVWVVSISICLFTVGYTECSSWTALLKGWCSARNRETSWLPYTPTFTPSTAIHVREWQYCIVEGDSIEQGKIIICHKQVLTIAKYPHKELFLQCTGIYYAILIITPSAFLLHKQK